MARLHGAANLDPEVDNLIRAKVQLCSRLSIAVSREYLAALLEQEIMNQGYRAPSIENIKRKISAAHHAQDDPLRQAWTLSSLAENPIPSEALPAVMEASKERRAADDVLTIREALWMSRLYSAVEPKDLLFDWAFFYALDEQICHDFGVRPFTHLDSELMNDVFYARRAFRTIELWGIAEKHGDDPQQLRDLNLRDAEEIKQVTAMRRTQEMMRQEAQNAKKRKARTDRREPEQEGQGNEE